MENFFDCWHVMSVDERRTLVMCQMRGSLEQHRGLVKTWRTSKEALVFKDHSVDNVSWGSSSPSPAPLGCTARRSD